MSVTMSPQKRKCNERSREQVKYARIHGWISNTSVCAAVTMISLRLLSCYPYGCQLDNIRGPLTERPSCNQPVRSFKYTPTSTINRTGHSHAHHRKHIACMHNGQHPVRSQ